VSAKEITAAGAKRLKGSFAPAASLCFLAMLSYTGLWLGGRLAAIFLDTLLLQKSQRLSPTSAAGMCLTVLFCLLLLSPFRLGVKCWYQRLCGEFLPLRGAFSCFSSFKRYLPALWFILVRYGAVFFCFLLPQLPALFFFAAVRSALDAGQVLGALYGGMLALAVVFSALGLCFSLYAAMGLFLTDYLYALGETRSPFAAMAASWRLMSGRRAGLFRLLVRVSPYGLLCLLVAPIPFALPNIRSALAVYAEDAVLRG